MEKFRVDKEYVQKRFKVMDSVKRQLNEDMDRGYEDVVKKIQRTDDRGNELNAVNINLSRQKAYLVTQYMCQIFLYQNGFFMYKGQCADDIDGAKVFQDYGEYLIRTIPAWEELAFKWILQATIKGFSPAKMIPRTRMRNEVEELQHIDFYPLHTNALWLDPQWATGLVRDQFHKIRLSKADLQDFIKTGKYDKSETNRFISEVKKPQGKDPRKKDLSQTNKSIPDEQHEGEYTIREYWFLKENTAIGKDEWMLQVWGIKEDGEIEYKLRPKKDYKENDGEYEKTPYWMGSPFLNLIDVPTLYLFTGYGEPALVRNYQTAINRTLNQELDWNDVASHPPILIDEKVLIDNPDLYPLQNPRFGGVAVFQNLRPGSIDWFRLPPKSGNAAGLLGYLGDGAQRASIIDDYLTGKGSRIGEPATTSVMNRDQAMGAVTFRAWCLGWGFKDFARKLLICMQQYGSTEDIIRIAGKKGYDFIKLSKEGRKSKKDFIMVGELARERTPLGVIYEEKTVQLRADKEEALKFYDIEVDTTLRETPQELSKKEMSALTAAINAPIIGKRTDILRLWRQVLEHEGFRDVEILVPDDEYLTPALSRVIAMLGWKGIYEVLKQTGALGRLLEEEIPDEILALMEREKKGQGTGGGSQGVSGENRPMIDEVAETSDGMRSENS